MTAFFILLVIVLGLAVLVFCTGMAQGKQHTKTQVQRKQLALRVSPVYQDMLDREHKRNVETRKLDFEQVVWQDTRKMQWTMLSAGLQSSYQVELRDAGKLVPPSVKIQEIKQEQGLLSAGYPVAPPFASIKSQIKPGKLILGYNMAGPIYGDVSDLLSMLFAGKPGTGKSTALLYYLSMLLLTEASVYVFDHQGSLNELADFLPYFGEFKNFAEPMPTIYQELREREEIWRDGRQVRKPMLILADELPAVARYEEKNRVQYSLLELAEEIVLEHRKHNVYCLLTGQSFPAEILPTITRDNCSSRVLFNSSDSHARMAGLDKRSRDKMLPLLKNAPQGTAILDVTRRPEPDIVAIPYTTVDDARNAIDVSRNFQNSYYPNEDFGNDFQQDYRPFQGNVSRFPDRYEIITETPKIVVSESQKLEIIRLQEEEGLNRTQIRDRLKWGGDKFKLIKAVLDEYDQQKLDA